MAGAGQERYDGISGLGFRVMTLTLTLNPNALQCHALTLGRRNCAGVAGAGQELHDGLPLNPVPGRNPSLALRCDQGERMWGDGP